MAKSEGKRILKSDRISFVLDKELTPILKEIARKHGMTQSKLINQIVLGIIIDNVDLLEDPTQIGIVQKMIKAKERAKERGF